MSAIFIHIPKTGGTSIMRGYRDHRGVRLAYAGHSSALHVQKRWPDKFKRAWKFAFVRNPWAHAVSWFYFRAKKTKGMPAAILKADLPTLQKIFREWLEQYGHDHIGKQDRNFHTMLCDTEGKLMVDHVYRFEEYGFAWKDIANHLGVPGKPEIHENPNPKRPPIPYQELYDDFCRGYVQGVQWWVIQEYGYSFED
jgi:hypothetical protein